MTVTQKPNGWKQWSVVKDTDTDTWSVVSYERIESEHSTKKEAIQWAKNNIEHGHIQAFTASMNDFDSYTICR